MSRAIDVLNPDRPKRVLILASNSAVSERTGWPIGFWWAELTHSYREFVEREYEVDVASAEGGKLEGDALLAVGGQGPMYTFHRREDVHALFRTFYEAGKPLAVICHATCYLRAPRGASRRRKPARREKNLAGFANSK